MTDQVMEPVGSLREQLLSMCDTFARGGPYGHPLSPPTFTIDDRDLEQMFLGIRHGLITFAGAAGRFNTLDRPIISGHWGLLSFYKSQTIINGEYLPQLAGYVDLIERLGLHQHRVLFEPGDLCHRIDHAVLDDGRCIVVVGEAKVDPAQPDDLVRRIRQDYAKVPPTVEERPPGKGPQYESWKLAVAMWKIRAPFLWLTAPGTRHAYRVGYEPLALEPLADLPNAAQLGLQGEPTDMLASIDYR